MITLLNLLKELYIFQCWLRTPVLPLTRNQRTDITWIQYSDDWRSRNSTQNVFKLFQEQAYLQNRLRKVKGTCPYTLYLLTCFQWLSFFSRFVQPCHINRVQARASGLEKCYIYCRDMIIVVCVPFSTFLKSLVNHFLYKLGYQKGTTKYRNCT